MLNCSKEIRKRLRREGFQEGRHQRSICSTEVLKVISRLLVTPKDLTLEIKSCEDRIQSIFH